MWLLGQFYPNSVSRLHGPTPEHDPHDARLANKVAVCVVLEYRRQQTLLKIVNLGAGISQTCHFNYSLETDVQQSSSGQFQQLEAARGNVFAQLTGRDLEAFTLQLLEQLERNQVDLAQIGLAGVGGHPRAVLHGHALVSVALHA